MKELFDKLDNYESRFSPAVWEQISSNLEKQNKKRRLRLLGLYSAALLVLVSASFGTYLYYFPCSADSDSYQAIATLEQQEAKSFKTFEATLLPTYTTTDSDLLSKAKADEGNIQANDVRKKTAQAYLQKNNKITTASREHSIGFSSNTSANLVGTPSLALKSQSIVDNGNYSIPKSTIPLADIDDRDHFLTPIFRFSLKKSCPHFEKKKMSVYAWSHASLLSPISTFKASDQVYTEYSESRTRTETGLSSGEVAIGLGMKFKDGFYGETGIQVGYLREKFSYIDPETVSHQTIITIDTFINQLDTLIAMDTTTLLVPGSREIVNYNSLKTISIPLVVGFERRLNYAFSAGVKVGAILNIKAQYEGRILDDNMTPMHLANSESGSYDIYKKTLSTQFLLGGQLNYHLSNTTQIYLAPELRFTASSVTKSDYVLRQNFVIPTLSTGIRYLF